MNYILPISCLLFRRSGLSHNSTTLSRVINSLFIIKTYLICNTFVIPAKISFCRLKVWTVIKGSQLQLVFAKHHMISLKYTAVHLMTKNCTFDDCAEFSSGKLCQLSDSNLDSESDSNSNSDSNASCLVSFYPWKTPDKHVTKINISDPFAEATERFKESAVSLKRHMYLKRSQNRHYNDVKESLDQGQIFVHVEYV